MSAEDLEKYETEMELQLYREYRDVVGLFSHVVETERRFYLTNQVELNVRTADNGEVFFEVTMQDAWVWDMYRPARFVQERAGCDLQGREHRGTRAKRPGASRGQAGIPDLRKRASSRGVIGARTHRTRQAAIRRLPGS